MKSGHDHKIDFQSAVERKQEDIKRLYKKYGEQSWIHQQELDLKIFINYFNFSQKKIKALEISTAPESYINTAMRIELEQRRTIMEFKGINIGDIGHLTEEDYREMTRSNSIKKAREIWPDHF